MPLLRASFFGDTAVFGLSRARRCFDALFFAERAIIRCRLLLTLFVVWWLSCEETLLIPGASPFFGDGGVLDFIPYGDIDLFCKLWRLVRSSISWMALLAPEFGTNLSIAPTLCSILSNVVVCSEYLQSKGSPLLRTTLLSICRVSDGVFATVESVISSEMIYLVSLVSNTPIDERLVQEQQDLISFLFRCNLAEKVRARMVSTTPPTSGMFGRKN